MVRRVAGNSCQQNDLALQIWVTILRVETAGKFKATLGQKSVHTIYIMCGPSNVPINCYFNLLANNIVKTTDFSHLNNYLTRSKTQQVFRLACGAVLEGLG